MNVCSAMHDVYAHADTSFCIAIHTRSSCKQPKMHISHQRVHAGSCLHAYKHTHTQVLCNPIALPCGHRFCMKCVSPSSFFQKDYKCPVCFKEHNLNLDTLRHGSLLPNSSIPPNETANGGWLTAQKTVSPAQDIVHRHKSKTSTRFRDISPVPSNLQHKAPSSIDVSSSSCLSSRMTPSDLSMMALSMSPDVKERYDFLCMCWCVSDAQMSRVCELRCHVIMCSYSHVVQAPFCSSGHATHCRPRMWLTEHTDVACRTYGLGLQNTRMWLVEHTDVAYRTHGRGLQVAYIQITDA